MTVYRSNCGCIRSAEEPEISDRRYACRERETDAECVARFHSDHDAWCAEWRRQCEEHAASTAHRT